MPQSVSSHAVLMLTQGSGGLAVSQTRPHGGRGEAGRPRPQRAAGPLDTREDACRGHRGVQEQPQARAAGCLAGRVCAAAFRAVSPARGKAGPLSKRRDPRGHPEGLWCPGPWHVWGDSPPATHSRGSLGAQPFRPNGARNTESESPGPPWEAAPRL